MSQAATPCSPTPRARVIILRPAPSRRTRRPPATILTLLFRASADCRQVSQPLAVPRVRDPGPNSYATSFLTSPNGAPVFTADYGWSICRSWVYWSRRRLLATLSHSRYSTFRSASRHRVARLCRGWLSDLTRCTVRFALGIFAGQWPGLAAVVRSHHASGCNWTCSSRV